MKKRALLTCALLALSGASFAQTIAVSSSTASTAGGATTPATTTVTFTSGATAVADYLIDVTFDGSRLDATAAAANGATCTVTDSGAATGSRVRVIAPTPGPVATNIHCNVTFTVVAGAAATLNLTPTIPPGNGCFDSMGNNVNCTLTPGTITVSAGNSPALAYVPAPNAALTTVTFPGGAVGGTANSTITVTPSGSTGGANTAVNSCAVSGQAGGGTFGTPTVTGSPFTTTAGSINLTCTRAATAGTATLTCQELESDGTPAAATPRVWGMTCPAGAVNTYTSTAALTFGNQNVGTASAAQNIAVVAAAGNTGNVSITGCTFGGTNPGDFAFSPAQTFPISVAPNATVNLPVAFTPAAAGARAGSVTCQTANAATASFTTNFTGTGVAAAANFTATTAPGNVTLPSVSTGQITSAGFQFNNTGNASGTISCAVTGTGFTVVPTGSQTVGAGANLTFTVSASSTTPGTLTGTLTCTPSVGTPFVYNLTAVITQALVTQIPAFGDFGRWALLGLMAGLGAMVAFRKRG